MIYFPYRHFNSLKSKYAKIFETYKALLLTVFIFSDFSSFTFKVPVKKVVADKEELHGIEIDGMLNLENLSRAMLID